MSEGGVAMSSLKALWLSFPEDPEFPIGFGVTAHSLEDAMYLLEVNGYDFHRRAVRFEVREVVTPSDIDYDHVAVNSGPHVVRGVWYPALNIGFGAP
jgi:hypothetical protein